MIKKFWIVALLLAAVVVGGGGCMSAQKQPETKPAQNANELALLHMQEKYGEEFTYGAPWGNSMTGTREFLAFCDSLPGKPVVVQIKDFKSDAPVYSDNYLAVKYEEEAIAYLQKEAEAVFGDVKVYHTANKQCVSENLSADASFETFYADASAKINAYIEVNGGGYTSTEQFEDFFSRLHGSSGSVKISIIVVDENIFGTLELEDLNMLPYKREAVAHALGKTVNGNFQYELTVEG